MVTVSLANGPAQTVVLFCTRLGNGNPFPSGVSCAFVPVPRSAPFTSTLRTATSPSPSRLLHSRIDWKSGYAHEGYSIHSDRNVNRGLRRAEALWVLLFLGLMYLRIQHMRRSQGMVDAQSKKNGK